MNSKDNAECTLYVRANDLLPFDQLAGVNGWITDTLSFNDTVLVFITDFFSYRVEAFSKETLIRLV